MARGVGKALVAAAKLLSNPVGAVASVFRKKGLKRGPTAASAGMVRRRYKKRGAASRPVISNDGNGNIKMARKIGSQPRRLSKMMESKIRDMLNPANHHVIQQTGNVNISNGKCTYTHFEMMNAEDIDEVIAQSANLGGTNYNNSKINIQNCHLQLTLRNQTTNLVYLTVYEYICRRSVPDKMETVPGSGVEVDGNTKDAIEYGFNYQQTHQIDYQTLGGTLFQNPFFCTYYKITKVRKLMLGAGKCLGLSLSNLRSRVINPLIYNNTDGDVEAGLTRGFVIQASGSLVGSEGHSSSATTGFVNFDWFCSRKYAYNQPYWGQAKNTYASNVPQPEVPQYHINEYTGAPQIQAEA